MLSPPLYLSGQVFETASKYSLLIAESCQKSLFSIRNPSKVADPYYEKEIVEVKFPKIEEKIVETENPPFDFQKNQVSSYFSYSGYNFLYEFFDSFEFINLEKKFLYFQSLDISKCFYNIYTHSISWAFKSKEYAKKNIGKSSFENNFDNLIQKSNHNETNGIVVGPEFSRIFAEVILQGVDRRIEKHLSQFSKVFNIDYSIRRYVDDYFIFTNDLRLQEEIREVIMEKLNEIKLYINEKKTMTTSRPFVDVRAKSKLDTSEHLEIYYQEIWRDNPLGFHSAKTITNATRKIIRRLASIAKEDTDGYQSICRYGISIITNKSYFLLTELINNVGKDELDKPQSQSFIKNNLELAFYLYSMDCNVRTTYLLGKYILLLTRLLVETSNATQSLAKQYIFELSTKHLEAESNISMGFSIEMFNLLIILHDLGEKYLMPERLLAKLLRLRASEKPETYEVPELEYFQAVSGLYYVRDHAEYNSIRSALEAGINRRFAVGNLDTNYTEHFLFLMDISSCPWLKDDTKLKIVQQSLAGIIAKNKITTEAKKLLNFLKRKTWFFNWKSADHLGTMLLKKELNSSY